MKKKTCFLYVVRIGIIVGIVLSSSQSYANDFLEKLSNTVTGGNVVLPSVPKGLQDIKFDTIDDAASTPKSVVADDLVFSIQNNLKELNYDVGVPDGLMGEKTEEAIKKYERKNDLEITGKATKQINAALQTDVSDAKRKSLQDGTIKVVGPAVIGVAAYAAGEKLEERDEYKGKRVKETLGIQAATFGSKIINSVIEQRNEEADSAPSEMEYESPSLQE